MSRDLIIDDFIARLESPAPGSALAWLAEQTPAIARIKAQRNAEKVVAVATRTCIFCAGTTDGDRPYCAYCTAEDI